MSPAVGSMTWSAPAASAASRRIFTASMPTTGPAPAASRHRSENCPMMPSPNTAALRPSVRPARTLTPIP